MEDLTGKRLGPYQVVAPLGQGGMAAVYKAFQPNMNRYVALKILPRHLAGDLQFIGRFNQEARVIANLQHPHILPVHDFGEADGYTYIVMPFVESGTLANLLEGRPLPLQQIRSIISQMGDALDYAHSQGVIHRDVKPSNVLVDTRGNCLLTDFGIAKMVEGTAQFTGTGGVVGTPIYMSPEQGVGSKVDGRSDIYSLGVMLYQMATGRVPFNAETPIAIVIKHINDPLLPPRSLNPEMSEALERVILKALAKQPEDRFATAGEMVQALQEAISDVAQETRPAQASLPVPPSSSGKETAERSVERAMAEASGAQLSVAPQADQRANVPAWVWFVGGLLGLGILIGLFVLVSGGLRQGEAAAQPGTKTALAVVSLPTATLRPSATPEPPTPTPTITPQPALGIGSTQVSEVDGGVMVYVPPGEFLMGSADTDPNARDDEKPQHFVYLDAFWIDRTEITNAMFAKFADETGYQTDADQADRGVVYNDGAWSFVDGANWRHPRGPNTNLDGKEDHPVVQVSWNDAVAYCSWAGRRLPTEAEWEKAARGTDGRITPWGDDDVVENRLNYTDSSLNAAWADKAANDGYEFTSPVGSYPEGATVYGALDMAGNVREWVADWYDAEYYATSPVANPKGPESGEARSMRGHSWVYGIRPIRVALRIFDRVAVRVDDIGFRCAQ